DRLARSRQGRAAGDESGPDLRRLGERTVAPDVQRGAQDRHDPKTGPRVFGRRPPMGWVLRGSAIDGGWLLLARRRPARDPIDAGDPQGPQPTQSRVRRELWAR